MPVTNSHSDEELPWTKPGMTGMKIKPTGRGSGVLAELAGTAENVAGLSAEERAARGRPEPLLQWSDTPPHVAVTDPSHYKTPASPLTLVFRLLERVIAGVVAVLGVLPRLVRRIVSRG
jgi:hypothetical protein